MAHPQPPTQASERGHSGGKAIGAQEQVEMAVLGGSLLPAGSGAPCE